MLVIHSGDHHIKILVISSTNMLLLKIKHWHLAPQCLKLWFKHGCYGEPSKDGGGAYSFTSLLPSGSCCWMLCLEIILINLRFKNGSNDCRVIICVITSLRNSHRQTTDEQRLSSSFQFLTPFKFVQTSCIQTWLVRLWLII